MKIVDTVSLLEACERWESEAKQCEAAAATAQKKAQKAQASAEARAYRDCIFSMLTVIRMNEMEITA